MSSDAGLVAVIVVLLLALLTTCVVSGFIYYPGRIPCLPRTRPVRDANNINNEANQIPPQPVADPNKSLLQQESRPQNNANALVPQDHTQPEESKNDLEGNSPDAMDADADGSNCEDTLVIHEESIKSATHAQGAPCDIVISPMASINNNTDFLKRSSEEFVQPQSPTIKTVQKGENTQNSPKPTISPTSPTLSKRRDSVKNPLATTAPSEFESELTESLLTPTITNTTDLPELPDSPRMEPNLCHITKYHTQAPSKIFAEKLAKRQSMMTRKEYEKNKSEHDLIYWKASHIRSQSQTIPTNLSQISPIFTQNLPHTSQMLNRSKMSKSSKMKKNNGANSYNMKRLPLLTPTPPTSTKSQNSRVLRNGSDAVQSDVNEMNGSHGSQGRSRGRESLELITSGMEAKREKNGLNWKQNKFLKYGKNRSQSVTSTPTSFVDSVVPDLSETLQSMPSNVPPSGNIKLISSIAPPGRIVSIAPELAKNKKISKNKSKTKNGAESEEIEMKSHGNETKSRRSIEDPQVPKIAESSDQGSSSAAAKKVGKVAKPTIRRVGAAKRAKSPLTPKISAREGSDGGELKGVGGDASGEEERVEEFFEDVSRQGRKNSVTELRKEFERMAKIAVDEMKYGHVCDSNLNLNSSSNVKKDDELMTRMRHLRVVDVRRKSLTSKNYKNKNGNRAKRSVTPGATKTMTRHRGEGRGVRGEHGKERRNEASCVLKVKDAKRRDSLSLSPRSARGGKSVFVVEKKSIDGKHGQEKTFELQTMLSLNDKENCRSPNVGGQCF